MEAPVFLSEAPHRIFSFDQDVMGCLSRVSIDVLRHTQLSGPRVNLEEGVLVPLVEAVGQGVEHRAKVWAVCVRGNNLNGERKNKQTNKQKNPVKNPQQLKHYHEHLGSKVKNYSRCVQSASRRLHPES